jgi:hypothetical protein
MIRVKNAPDVKTVHSSNIQQNTKIRKKKLTENYTIVYIVLKSRKMYPWKTYSSVDIASRNFSPFDSVCIVTHARCNALFCDQIFSCVPTALFLSLTPKL